MQNKGMNQFLKKIVSNSISPQVALNTRITEKSATLIDGIFTNSYERNSNCVSGNINAYNSDHLIQFLIY